MSFDMDEGRWMCGRSGMVNLQRVSSIVREISEPCLHHSPTKGTRMLKREKWQTIFDCEGKIFGFRKVLKLIKLGGVDPSIRAEVWEFLLGCYALNSTAESRRQLRMARRERYEDLVRQCQNMHSSIGTGSLAYVVGSKVMDMRTLSKENDTRESNSTTNKVEAYADSNNGCTDSSYTNNISKCSRNATELISVRESAEDAAYDTSYLVPSSGTYDCFSTAQPVGIHDFEYGSENIFDFSSMPFTNLFHNGDRDIDEIEMHDVRNSFSQSTPRYDDDHMHSFQINDNEDLIMETNAISKDLFHASNHEIEIFRSDVQYNTETVNRRSILNVPETTVSNRTTSNGQIGSEDRVSEWLWTLHRIVVDVVRTDSHLDFYGDSKNMARMSDILAVYAWIDPGTGYCQGMSDLLSPFVVLYEDNADAFWCFEMLLRRMRENFQMEGPTGVMKQLQALWKILELTDAEMFGHLSAIGAESLHFAFRMLLVLFRRELSFDEALCMWEMMWAADFDEGVTQQLEENCLEPLILHPRKNSSPKAREESSENDNGKFKSAKPEHNNDGTHSPYSNGLSFRSISNHPFCGLTRANFWAKNDDLPCSVTTPSTRNRDDELPVFCVAAILIINRQRIMRQTCSFDDVIKMFNDNKLKINVKRCIRTAIKIRKKYFYKLIRHASISSSENTKEE